ESGAKACARAARAACAPPNCGEARRSRARSGRSWRLRTPVGLGWRGPDYGRSASEDASEAPLPPGRAGRLRHEIRRDPALVPLAVFNLAPDSPVSAALFRAEQTHGG